MDYKRPFSLTERMSLTESGADVLHDWIDVCETRAKKHLKRSSQFESLSLNSRAFLIILMGVFAITSLIRVAMNSSMVEFAYSMAFSSAFLLLIFFFGNASIDKSTFHLRMSHELSFMKQKCSLMLSERKSPEIVKNEYNTLMTRSNKMLNMMG